MNYTPARQPTLYFIGVTTTQSSIMTVFPAWMKFLGLQDAAIRGMDFPLDAAPEEYHNAVKFIHEDPLSLGALVTTHKISLFQACKDMFDEIDPYARLMGETSCLSKLGGRLVCHAKDPISSGLTIDLMLKPGHFSRSAGEVFCIGAGGSAIAITCHLMQKRHDGNLPSRIVVSDRDQARLHEMKNIHKRIDSNVPVSYVHVGTAEDNDAILAKLLPGSFVINATGLGKDRPGSPLTNNSQFPLDGIIWDLNYRGNLIFLDQARRQQLQKNLQIEDGWKYFLHGWTRVIAEVFHVDIPRDGPGFDALSKIAIAAASA